MDDMSLSVAEMQRRAAHELGLPSRLGYTALLIAALAMGGLTGSLWLTEPALPLRTQVAFAVSVAIALSWAALAAWVLARRRVLFANHRVYAARMAAVFTGIFLAGAVVLRTRVGAAAMGVAGVMFVAACVALFMAQRRRATLLQRRRALEEGR